ncbi:LacI family transcriptional regulator [Quadrisphaera granulorum]|uniref:LacI family transcriptional regulator n=1 Tax=Quadrisphaera granulorum TaxID=317664 RepID=A0A316AE27_9ACTN|nr:substrate-binding domain-containing protein [Quadrisphaera granulorum]PWJ55220.1 LacI family transcriptional regulator [Quadrisphaera granulorum]SZE95729.1 LacI family transcriptional regulator [Quadrisphaera granulorum]
MTNTAERVTIADVARRAGVSVPTVSKVLNGRDDVAPATRDHVTEVITTTGYRPRRRQQEPRSGAPLVELVITDLTSAYALEVLAGAEESASRAGAGLVVNAAHDHDGGDRSWLRALRERRPSGVVLVINRFGGGSAEDVASLGAPVVLLDPAGSSDPSLPTVGATNFAGGVTATEHLLSLGHRRIATITGLPFLLCSQERLEGYRAAMARAGVPVDESLVAEGDFTAAGGQRAAVALLDHPNPPTAIFAGSDLMASGVYQEARCRGLHVPDDLSVVGFDDVSMCQYLSPPLTTVRQPLGEMAGESVRMVLDAVRERRAGPSARPQRDTAPHLQLATRLVVRESTAAPSA